MRRPSRTRSLRTVAIAAVVFCVAGGGTDASAGTLFDIDYDGNVPAEVRDAFNAACGGWSSLLRDEVTVKIEVGWKALDPWVLGEAYLVLGVGHYDAVRNLVASGGEPGDAREAALLPNLPTSTEVNVSLPDGFSYNNKGYITWANYKALGGPDSGLADGYIDFSSNFSWDYDPTDGITGGAYDLQGVAQHEIGHILGFYSGIDRVDKDLKDLEDGVEGVVTDDVGLAALDLFRFDTNHLGSGFDFTDTPRNLTPGGSHSFYYGDGSIAMSTGYHMGDGYQGSHWEQRDLALGIMDPTGAAGETLVIGENDLIALDLIGWDVVPEPSTFVLMLSGLLAIGYAARRRR